MQPEDLESHVTALEGEVRANKVEVTAVRELVRSVDRDVSEMRGFRQTSVASLNALRADMVDMRQEMRTKFDVTAAGQQRIVELIQTVVDTQGGAAPT